MIQTAATTRSTPNVKRSTRKAHPPRILPKTTGYSCTSWRTVTRPNWYLVDDLRRSLDPSLMHAEPLEFNYFYEVKFDLRMSVLPY